VLSRKLIKNQRGRRPLTAMAVLTLIGGMLISGGTALALTQNAFELDKNATNDLTTEHLGTLKSKINAGAANTTLVVCERQFTIDPDGNGPLPPVTTVVAIPSTPFTIQVDGETMTVTNVPVGTVSTGGCGFKDPADSTAKARNWTVTRGAGAPLHSGGADVTLKETAASAPDDWNDVKASIDADLAANPPITANHTCADIGATACAFITDPTGTTIYTTGGSKDDLNINPQAGESGTGWKCTAGSVPDADEILHGFASKYTTSVSGADHQMLFFGADREATNGAKDFGFWFFHSTVACNEATGLFTGTHTRPDPQTGARGDILLLGTFTNGGAVSTLRVFEWVGVGGNTNGTLQALGSFGDCAAGGGNTNGCTTINNTTVPAPWAYNGKNVPASGQFYSSALMEGGLDLTALGLEGCFASFLAETRSAPEVGAQLKDFLLGSFESCESDLVTTPKDGDGNSLDADSDDDDLPEITIGAGAAGVDVRDSAAVEVTGTTNFTGNLSFFICGPIASGTCDTGGVPVAADTGVNPVTANGDYLSASVNLTSVGRYCWRGVFDSNTASVDDQTDSSVGECFEVMPRDTTLDTAAVASSVVLKSAVQDNATLGDTANQPGTNGGVNGTYLSIGATNGAPAGGKITFTLVKDDCTTLATGTGTNPQDFTPISGDGTYGPVSFTPDAVGTYHWQAVYTPAASDPNNNGSSHNAACGDSEETVIVTGTASLSTAQDWLPNDTATLTGDTNLTGTLTFQLYTGNNCGDTSGEAIDGQFYSVDVDDAASGSTFSTDNEDSFLEADSGDYSWLVTYVDDNLTSPDPTCEITTLTIDDTP
jgi:hypothetical protein